MAEQTTQKRRCALVTGGSRGIGRAICEELAQAGFDIAIVYAGNEEAARKTAAQVEMLGAAARIYRCDVADAEAATACAEQVLADFGGVWALVNNAGITRDTLLARMREEDFDRVIDVNLKGTYHMMRALTRSFMRQRGGCIVNMSSIEAFDLGSDGDLEAIGADVCDGRDAARAGNECVPAFPGGEANG